MEKRTWNRGEEVVKGKSYPRLVTIALLAFIMVMILPMAVMAAPAAPGVPSLQWQTERVYYDYAGQLVIEGYFFNNGTAIVNGINWMYFQVYFKGQYTNWWLQTEATFKDIDVFIFPGKVIRWQFNIINVDYQPFDYWNVRYDVNYNYQY